MSVKDIRKILVWRKLQQISQDRDPKGPRRQIAEAILQGRVLSGETTKRNDEAKRNESPRNELPRNEATRHDACHRSTTKQELTITFKASVTSNSTTTIAVTEDNKRNNMTVMCQHTGCARDSE